MTLYFSTKLARLLKGMCNGLGTCKKEYMLKLVFAPFKKHSTRVYWPLFPPAPILIS